MRRWQLRGAAMVIGCGLAVAVPLSAAAADPLVLEELTTDEVGALGGREGEVDEAQSRLFEDHQLDLFVVYVDTFGTRPAEEWAQQTAELNLLDINDALLAVATDDREFHLWLADDYPVNRSERSAIDAVVLRPALDQFDWAGAAIGAADGLRAVLQGDELTEPEIVPGDSEPSPGTGVPWVPIVLVGVGVVAVALFAYRRSRNRHRVGQATGLD